MEIIMKIAIPVKDENLIFFTNAGHAPYFAIFTVNGNGMFRSFNLEKVIKNPKVDGEDDHHHGDDEDHVCDHDDNDIEHIKKHDLMAEAIKECNYIVLKKACKNTIKSFNAVGLKVSKYNGTSAEAKMILSESSSQFK
jgi:predicted Fe-Mo cluster-binding NifX family protein